MERNRDVEAILNGKPLAERAGVFFFSEPPADVKPSKDTNPTNRRSWSYWRQVNYHFLREKLAASSKDAVLIDIGAGQSDFRDLTEQFSSYAVDFYPYPGIDVVADFTKEIPLKDHSADILLLTNVLEHVKEPDVLLAECYRILKPGGMLLGTVPFLIQIHQRPYDYYRYTDINLEYRLEKARFRKIEIRSVSNLSVLLLNVATSFFVQAIRGARIKLLWRLAWKMVRIVLSLFRRFPTERFADPESPLGYLFEARKSE